MYEMLCTALLSGTKRSNSGDQTSTVSFLLMELSTQSISAFPVALMGCVLCFTKLGLDVVQNTTNATTMSWSVSIFLLVIYTSYFILC